ncbi:hypothetical protein C4D60_Mb10t11620 [Musa balbisiana]|uniref:Uncharacterized protein n=1 Tax=Musa balbisiana TaxID=52838 RepID=A0A4S8IWH4_MUSBA|nr:hypothetical protein C4D60_Mb10t11620 [Musa balbisiana]
MAVAVYGEEEASCLALLTEKSSASTKFSLTNERKLDGAKIQESEEDAVLMAASKESKQMRQHSCSMKLLCKLSASSFSRRSKALLLYEASWKFRDRQSAAGLTCSSVGT